MLKPVALSAGLIAGAHAFWRMECPGVLGTARLDPIVDPNSVSTHAHVIQGSSSFSATSGSDELMKGQCTTCRVTQDRSAYWHPALYFQDAHTGQIEAVPQVGGMLSYYLLYGDKVTAFPHGFSMVAGKNTRRTFTSGDPNKPDPPKSEWAALGLSSQSALEEHMIGFNCLNYAEPPEGTLYRHRFPDKETLKKCTDGVRIELMFPSCWNGRDLDSEDHMSHMAYPDLGIDGSCQDTHPVRVPSLMYEVIWNTYAFNGRDGDFVFSNGDKTGYGYHGDFTTGWPTEFLQRAIDTCTNESGRIEDCPLFNVVDHDTATSCKWETKLPAALAHEDVTGPMSTLP
ncbi:hypothetical protein E4U42_001179, partial [Claviceps africana]